MKQVLSIIWRVVQCFILRRHEYTYFQSPTHTLRVCDWCLHTERDWHI